MAQGATVYNLSIELADVDRGVYESFELRTARHPAESAEYLVTRLLAYCCEYAEGISFTQGISAGDEPAIWLRDATGRVLLWVEVGLPDAERLHRGSKQSERTAVYTHRDVTQLLSQLVGKKIHRAAAIPVYAFDRRLIKALAESVDRRSTLRITITEGQLFVALGDLSLSGSVTTHSLAGSEEQVGCARAGLPSTGAGNDAGGAGRSQRNKGRRNASARRYKADGAKDAIQSCIRPLTGSVGCQSCSVRVQCCLMGGRESGVPPWWGCWPI
ncbi:YaeQ family protein [Candidatus Gracilibacteria bacterium]|nr:YaeQ family protein [Candidatus Gracilibacteria bacterium]